MLNPLSLCVFDVISALPPITNPQPHLYSPLSISTKPLGPPPMSTRHHLGQRHSLIINPSRHPFTLQSEA